MSGDRRAVVVPHLDGDVLRETEAVEELMLWLRVDADSPDRDVLDPDGVFDKGAEALGTLRSALSHAGPICCYGADGRWEHVDVLLLDVPSSAVDDFAAAVEAIEYHRGDLGDDLDEFAWVRRASADDVVDAARRFRDLTMLEWDADRAVLLDAFRRASVGDRVVLSSVEDAAFFRLCERFVSVWHRGESMSRWMYGLMATQPGAAARAQRRPSVAYPPPARRDCHWR